MSFPRYCLTLDIKPFYDQLISNICIINIYEGYDDPAIARTHFNHEGLKYSLTIGTGSRSCITVTVDNTKRKLKRVLRESAGLLSVSSYSTFFEENKRDLFCH